MTNDNIKDNSFATKEVAKFLQVVKEMRPQTDLASRNLTEFEKAMKIYIFSVKKRRGYPHEMIYETLFLDKLESRLSKQIDEIRSLKNELQELDCPRLSLEQIREKIRRLEDLTNEFVIRKPNDKKRKSIRRICSDFPLIAGKK